MQREPEVLANAPRCLARTRSGTPCQSPAVRGKRRCRMHGGTNPGAPRGNRNALKHGLRTAEVVQLRALLTDLNR
ncbi:HGGxSTG domain-containing protein [uncultured Sphingomonas sp.]|uniref:HGGxSTG domain-containing protein n=1 Tax=uncultured Sphingomonas sp. TaxID=158754 RepID=UPI003458330B